MEIRRMLCVALLLPLYCYADLSISGEYDADSAPPAAHIEKQPENGSSIRVDKSGLRVDGEAVNNEPAAYHERNANSSRADTDADETEEPEQDIVGWNMDEAALKRLEILNQLVLQELMQSHTAPVLQELQPVIPKEKAVSGSLKQEKGGDSDVLQKLSGNPLISVFAVLVYAGMVFLWFRLMWRLLGKWGRKRRLVAAPCKTDDKTDVLKYSRLK